MQTPDPRETTGTTPVLAIEGLTVALPPGADRAHAVEGVSLSLRAGETLCVVGESGSGKSVTASAVMGLLAPGLRIAAGRVRLGGEPLPLGDEAAMRALRGRRLGMVFQEPMTALNPLMRAGDQVAEAFEAHALLTPAARRARAVELLAEVGLPDPARLARAYPHELSGGQRQRVVIAAALALEPALLICDEPTTALDVTTQAQILALIARLRRERGTAVLFITHDFGVVADIADRVAVMHAGRVVEQGTAAEVLRAPREDYTRRLLAAVPALAPPPPRPAPAGDPVIEVTDLTKAYRPRGLLRRGREVRAVDGVSLAIRRGETLGLVGESGSGKSTVAKLLVRLLEPDGGSIRLGGTETAGLSAAAYRPLRRRAQIVFQDPFSSLNPRKTAGRIVAEGPRAQGVPAARARERARALLAEVGLPPEAEGRYPHEFSGGQRQRIGLARALALEPDLLIADEPVSALDVSVQAQVLDLLEALRARRGLAVLFVTHDLRVAARVCDRLAVMRAGRIVEQGLIGEVFAHPRDPYTRALLASAPGAGGRA